METIFILDCVVLGELFPKQAQVFTCVQYKSFENTFGKEEIAHNEQFLPFPTVFSILSEKFPLISSSLKLLSANSFSLEEFRSLSFGKGLRRDCCEQSSMSIMIRK